MSLALRSNLKNLETTTQVTLAILALASGVYTYLGVRGLLQGVGPIVFFGALVYSVAVSVGIYAFWTYLMKFMPHVNRWRDRSGLFVAMMLGSAMIIAMSSWLNAAALAGGAALEQHLANTTEDYQQRLDKAHSNALAAQSLLPDIELAAERFRRLASEEQASGTLTGTSGSGTVVQLLRQMSGQLRRLAEQVRESREQVDSLFEQGTRHLGQMRRVVSSSGPLESRNAAFADEAVTLAGVIASLQQTSIAPSVKRAAEDLTSTFVAPVADGGTQDLVARQNAVVNRVEQAIRAQARALSRAADEILARDPVKPLRFTPLSTPEAVLRYAEDFLPSWAGAISIDLMPAVLILILSGVHAAIRRNEGTELDENSVTAAEMMRAMRLYHVLREEDRALTAAEDVLAAAGRQIISSGDDQPVGHAAPADGMPSEQRAAEAHVAPPAPYAPSEGTQAASGPPVVRDPEMSTRTIAARSGSDITAGDTTRPDIGNGARAGGTKGRSAA